MASALHHHRAATRVLFASDTIPNVAQLAERLSVPGTAPDALTTRAAQHARLEMARGLSFGRTLERAHAWLLWERGNRACAWCDQPIRALSEAEELGCALVHHSCAVEFGEWANEDEDARLEREHGPRARQALADVLAGAPDLSEAAF